MGNLEERYQKLRRKFAEYGQDHVFRFWDELSPAQKEAFLEQLEAVDLDLIARLTRELIQSSPAPQGPRRLDPPDVIPVPKTEDQKREALAAAKMGEQLLREGKVGIILVAGGQGTRLGYSGPKGKFPVTPVRRKTLFQHHAEKILAIRRRYGVRIPWYIMTSEANDTETRQFFEENGYFGLPAEDVFFFRQDMIPSVSPGGKLLLERKDRIFTNPNGHGGTLQALFRSGALDDMRKRGIEELFYFQVDNVLVKICDPVFIGYHVQRCADMSCKIIPKLDPYEKVGVVGVLNGKVTVIEYSDLTEEEMLARNPDGSLVFGAGSIAIHMIRRDFIERLTSGDLRLPYHRAHKKIPYLDENGRRVEPEAPNGYKFEMFIFDALPLAREVVVMETERKYEYSVLKNAKGAHSPETVRQDLCNIWGEWLEAAGCDVPRDEQGNVSVNVEISPLFALDREEFLTRVKEPFSVTDGLYLGEEIERSARLA
jgi:UDP-N-acetylglucosamine/UDP-N-acetylgalactosamine diphosphorylase